MSHAVAVLLIDLDHFKQINDAVGHARGDAVLREAAARLRATLRTFESAYRVGGEEFLVLPPGGDTPAAVGVAERLCQAVRSEPCAGRAVTISVGVAVADPGKPLDYRDTFARAETPRCTRPNAAVATVCAWPRMRRRLRRWPPASAGPWRSAGRRGAASGRVSPTRLAWPVMRAPAR